MRAARKDARALGRLTRRTPYQRELAAEFQAGRANRLDELRADSGPLNEERAEIDQEIPAWEARRDSADFDCGAKATKLEQIPAPGPIGRMQRGHFRNLLVLLGAVDVPVVYLVLGPLPAPEIVRWTIAAGLGLFFVFLAHHLGAAAERLVHDEGETIEGNRDRSVHVATLVGGVSVLVGFVVTFAIVRGDELVKASELARFLNLTLGDTSGPNLDTGFRHPIFLGVAFGCWHAATLLLAFYLGYARAKGASWRHAADDLEEAQGRGKRAEESLLKLRKRREAIVERLATLDARAEHHLEQLFRLYQAKEAVYLTVLTRACNHRVRPTLL